MAWQRWQFYDPVELEVWTVPINPSKVSEPSLKKNVAQQSTLAGPPMIVGGGRPIPEFKFEGTTLTNDHHLAFVRWWEKGNKVRITDDFGNQWWVYITEYTPERVRSHRHEKRTFTMTCMVVGEAS